MWMIRSCSGLSLSIPLSRDPQSTKWIETMQKWKVTSTMTSNSQKTSAVSSITELVLRIFHKISFQTARSKTCQVVDFNILCLKTKKIRLHAIFLEVAIITSSLNSNCILWQRHLNTQAALPLTFSKTHSKQALQIFSYKPKSKILTPFSKLKVIMMHSAQTSPATTNYYHPTLSKIGIAL